MTYKPDQMYTHRLDGVKGWPGPYAVDKAVDLDPDVDHTTVKAGMIVHIDPTSKKFVLGTGTVTATRAPMPFFLFQNGADFDVVGDHGNIVGAQEDAARGARLMGLSANGGYELETTEYTVTTYASGDLLIGHTDGKAKIVESSGATVICGVVSDGLVANEDIPGGYVLRFHSVFCPRFA